MSRPCAQSFIDFPPPPASQVGFDSSTAVVVNGALTAYDPNDLEVVFSKLDANVEYARRIERARQAWTLFINDVKQRSGTTMGMLLTTAHSNCHTLC